MLHSRSPRSAFTLIELLVVIAIIAVLAVVVILTLNPAELFRQSRDSSRLSDTATMTEVLSIFSEDVANGSLGTPSTLYVSIPDPSATSTAGDQCQGLTLPTLPSTWTYHCASPTNYKNVDGTGWIPANLTSISSRAPIGNLPVDPTNNNNASSGLYYTYVTDSKTFEVTAPMESKKYGVGGSNDVISTDGGPLASVYEKGNKLGLEPMDYGDSSLVGLWTFDEGAGSTAYDYSGNNATGSWSGTQAGTNGYYSAGNIGPYAGTFNGSNNYVNTAAGSLPLGNSPRSVFAWIYPTTGTPGGPIECYGQPTTAEWSRLAIDFGHLYFSGDGDDFQTSLNPTTRTWQFVGYTYNGGTSVTIYYDGQSQTHTLGQALNTILPGSDAADIGKASDGNDGYFQGLIDDVRVYNRALSAAEVQALYNGQK